jgi:hypothetical protein
MTFFQIRCRVDRSGFRVGGSDFRVGGSDFRVGGSGFRVGGSDFRVSGSRFRVGGSDFRVGGSRFRVDGSVRSLNYKNSLPAKQSLIALLALTNKSFSFAHRPKKTTKQLLLAE